MRGLPTTSLGETRQVREGKKIYFASDFHLGIDGKTSSRDREKLLVTWLREVAKDAEEIYLVGDLFDFWFEYKEAVPRGFTRVLGTLAELTDSGLPIHVFTGNHDMWIFDYLPKETGVVVHRAPIARDWNSVRFFIGHGDGLGPGDYGYKFIKRVFASKACQWLFARFHPNFGIALANFWSRTSRKTSAEADRTFLGEDNEWLVQYCREVLMHQHYDVFVFGHRHLPLDIALNDTSRYINLGDWLGYFTYAVFDGNSTQLLKYPDRVPFE
jgi:UDP-2,3-diacylglucosamine hydrolase